MEHKNVLSTESLQEAIDKVHAETGCLPVIIGTRAAINNMMHGCDKLQFKPDSMDMLYHGCHVAIMEHGNSNEYDNKLFVLPHKNSNDIKVIYNSIDRDIMDALLYSRGYLNDNTEETEKIDVEISDDEFIRLLNGGI